MQAGDVVRLKTGGPKMTVEKVTRDRVEVAWFVGEQLHRDCLYDIELVEAKDQ